MEHYGYAAEMAQALLEWAFNQPTVRRVIAECLVTNVPSIRVLKKIGIRKLSKTEDMIYWKVSNR